MTQKDIFNIIANLTGQNNILTIPTVFIDFTGDLETALFLSQLLYWTAKTKDGWIYKTYKDWEKEIKLTRRKVDKARKKLEDLKILETTLKKANGAPVVHYKIKIQAFIGLLTEFINRQNQKDENSDLNAPNEQMDLHETTNGFAQNEQIELHKMNKSNCTKRANPYIEYNIINNNINNKTETTTETTTENIYTPDASCVHIDKTDKTKKHFGEFNNVLLTETEYQKLKEKLGDLADKLIEDLSLYIASKGKKYKSHYATILSWSRKNSSSTTINKAKANTSTNVNEHNRAVIEKVKQKFKGAV